MSNKKVNKSTILIAEDDKRLLEMVAMGFSRQGFHVYKAENSRECFEILEGVTPDVILSDLNLSDFSGKDLFFRVKRKFGNNRPLFMLLSAQNSEMEIIECLRLGVDDFITKPFSLKQLILKISNHVLRVREQQKQMTCCLAGKLCSQGLADLIQFIELVEHSGSLLIADKDNEGTVIFNSGKVVDATYPPLTGRNAVYAMMALEEGRFCFNKHPVSSEVNTIGLDNYALILEGTKMMDEIGKESLIRSLQDTDSSVRFSEPQTPSQLIHASGTFTEPVSYSSPRAYESSPDVPEPLLLQELKPISAALPEWFKQCMQISDELKDINPGTVPVRNMKGPQLYTNFQRLHHPIMIPMIGSNLVLEAIFRSLSDLYTPYPPGTNTAPVARISLSTSRVLYLIGISDAQISVIPERIGLVNLPGIIWMEDENRELIRTALATWICPAMIAIASDPTQIPLDLLDRKDNRWIRTINASPPTRHNIIVVLRKIFKILSELSEFRDNR